MNTQDEIYELARMFIFDTSQALAGLDETLLGYVRSRSLKQLASCSDLFDGNNHTIETFRALRQIEAFFKKNAIFVDEVRCELAAREAFYEAELSCLKTNERLEAFYLNPHGFPEDIEFKVFLMTRYISNVLGSFSGFLEDLPRRIRITPGATATRNRRSSLPFNKVSMKPTITPGALPYIRSLYRFFGYSEPKPRLIAWNRVEAVPKNWKTHRLIACEPELNVPLQLAFDSWVKDKLRSFKIDLSDQSSNQEYARLGSINGAYCTIDLKAASDSLSLNVVHLLFPEKWTKFLMAVRTPRYHFGDERGKYEKFSSMGNGTTFCLETLVFAAACFACDTPEFNVYGDDIVATNEKFDEIVALLNFLGFETNDQKSFHAGPFRESCGTDWFDGSNVTPFYVRDWHKTGSLHSKSLACHNINGLASICLPGGLVWKSLIARSRSMNLPYVPYNGVSTSGVYIDVHSAYQQKLLRNWKGRQIVKYKALVSKDSWVLVTDVRALFLWHLDKYRRLEPKASPFGFDSIDRSFERHLDPKKTVERTRVPTLRHKVVRKWVCWIPPAKVTPVHLFKWTDDLLALPNGSPSSSS